MSGGEAENVLRANIVMIWPRSCIEPNEAFLLWPPRFLRSSMGSAGGTIPYSLFPIILYSRVTGSKRASTRSRHAEEHRRSSLWLGVAVPFPASHLDPDLPAHDLTISRWIAIPPNPAPFRSSQHRNMKWRRINPAICLLRPHGWCHHAWSVVCSAKCQ